MQQPVDIYVDAKQQRAFKRRAIAAFKRGVEYMEAIWVRRGVGEFHVVRFVKLPLEKQREDNVECPDEKYYPLRSEALREGFEFATVHSHTYGDSAPSEWDHKDSVKDGDCLVGVCFIWRDEKTKRIKTRLDFWQPQLPCLLKTIRS